MNKRMTRVVCTIGPASKDPEIIKQLIEKGMNVARLNFSHGTHDSHREMINVIRSTAEGMGTYVGILQDLCGPKIRLGILPDSGVKLIGGENISLRSNGAYEEGILPVTYPNLHSEVKPGESILLADGMIALQVSEIQGDKIVCKIINDGTVYSKKGVNMPNSNLKISAFSDKDRADLEMGLKEKVDFVALSFVRSSEDLKEIKEVISKSTHKPRLIAKIEKPQAVQNLYDILDDVDGLMVARGDLGVELPLELVPMIQKDIIKAVRETGKFVITATQMLMSMVSSPRPTRGETSDVANAILDGTDAVMLSDESASGHYPVAACDIMSKIAYATEPYTDVNLSKNIAVDSRSVASVSIAVGRAACSLAEDVCAPAIVAYTESGFTATAVARFRPTCPIIAITSKIETCRRLSMCWGTTAIHVNYPFTNTDDLFELATKVVVEAGIATKGDKLVFTAGVPIGKVGSTNLLRVLKVE